MGSSGKKISMTFLALIFALFLSGCLTAPAQLGCCLKQNASGNICALFNISSGRIDDLSTVTNGCNVENGNCNVSIGETTVLIPICTEDKPGPCVEADCVAMICGDFKYSKTISPGFVDESEIGEGAILSEEETPAQALYHAQCKFMAVDPNFQKVQKKTKSSMNIFRFGIGGSFDEFDQYRFYFPISDKYCSQNQQGTVDRYMNYIDSSFNPYDPIESLTETCLNDSAIKPPFTFGSSSQVIPDQSSYAFEDWRHWFAPFNTDGDEAVLGGQLNFTEYKKIDKGLYRKTLSSAYIDKFYQEGAFRAPFECDIGTSDCFSGSCNTQFYNRGVSVATQEDGTEVPVPTDCYATTLIGRPAVVCYPTVNVTPPSAPGGKPDFEYAKVSYRPWLFRIATETYNLEQLQRTYSDWEEGRNNYSFGGEVSKYLAWWCVQNDSGHNKCTMDWLWEGFFTRYMRDVPFADKGDMHPNEFYQPNAELFGDYKQLSLLPKDYGFSYNDSTEMWEAENTSGSVYPPAGQIVFFDNKNVYYESAGGREPIIGYAVVDPSEFEKTLFARNCGLFDSREIPWPFVGNDIIGYDEKACNESCTSDEHCGHGAINECNEYCHEFVTMNNASALSPCTFTIPAISSEETEGPDFIRVDLSDKEQYQRLMTAFEPLYNETVEYYANQDWDDGCGSWADSSDLFLISMPWLPMYKKVMMYHDNGDINDERPVLSSPGMDFFRFDNNIYGQGAIAAINPTLCNLKKISATKVGVGIHAADWGGIFYKALQPHYVYLLKNTTGINGTGKIGKCDLAPGSTLPKIKTYGWCEPCTYSTLAYQKLSVRNEPYIPELAGTSSTHAVGEDICEYNPSVSFRFGSIDVKWNMTCENPEITDIQQYSGIDPYSVGVPRTVPEATLVKERIGNYLKSGMMPVIDLSDQSNWNLSSPYGTRHIFTFFGVTSLDNTFEEYDFKRLLGNEGAMIVIVDDVYGSPTSEDTERVVDRTRILKSFCWRCLPAISMRPSSPDDYDKMLKTTVSDPRLRNADVIIALHYNTYGRVYNGTTDEERADSVVNDMASYGAVALNRSKPLPTLIVGFNARNDSNWNSSNYETLFSKIVKSQDKLVKSGIIGIIYSPARTDYAATDSGVVDTGTGIGLKTSKFCALEKAVNDFALTKYITIFNRILPSSSVNCTRCNAFDIVRGKCNTTCDNGEECVMPEGGEAGVYGCPPDTIAGDCTLCNATEGRYECEFHYFNGSVRYQNFTSSEVSSEAYIDVLAGMQKPSKCCIGSTSGGKYSFSQMVNSMSSNNPIVFSKSGNPYQDCGLGLPDPTSISQFCGAKIPLNDYKVNCTFIPEIPFTPFPPHP